MSDKEDNFSLGQYLLYKLDRSTAIVGIIAIAVTALFVYAPKAEGVQIASNAIAGLVGYIGGRAASR